MKNRYKTSRLVSSVPSRLSQIAHERERGLVQAEAGVPLPIGPIVKPEIDYDKKHYNLVKSVTPGPLDTQFDKFGIITTHGFGGIGATFRPAAGNQITIHSFRIPVGQRLILSQYCFFMLVDERPAIINPVLASPLELHDIMQLWLARADFLILVNGIVPGDMTYTRALAVDFLGNVTQSEDREGFTCLTENPNEASDPNHGGISFSFGGGSLIEVIFRNRTYAFGQPNTRMWVGVGFRFRGFLSPVNPEEK